MPDGPLNQNNPQALELARCALDAAVAVGQALGAEVWRGPLLMGMEAFRRAATRETLLGGLANVLSQSGDPNFPDRPLTLQQQQALRASLADFFRTNSESINQAYFGGHGTPEEMAALQAALQNAAANLRGGNVRDIAQRLSRFMQQHAQAIHLQHVRDNVTTMIDRRVQCRPTPRDGASLISQDLQRLSDDHLNALFGGNQAMSPEQLRCFRWALQRQDRLQQLERIVQRGGDVTRNVLNWAQEIARTIPPTGVLNLIDGIRRELQPQGANGVVRLPNENDQRLAEACDRISLGQGTTRDISELIGALTDPRRYGLSNDHLRANSANTSAFFAYAWQALANDQGAHAQHLRQIMSNRFRSCGLLQPILDTIQNQAGTRANGEAIVAAIGRFNRRQPTLEDLQLLSTTLASNQPAAAALLLEAADQLVGQSDEASRRKREFILSALRALGVRTEGQIAP